MTSDYITRFFQQRPFVPFVMYLADGRERQVPHSDFIAIGEHIAVVLFHHPDGQVEVIDSNLIVSFCTVQPSDFEFWSTNAP